MCLYHLLAERCVPDILKRAKDLKGTNEVKYMYLFVFATVHGPPVYVR
jgi:hypothetical protein